MTRLYMIRHGKPASSWGDQGADPDPGLDETGRAQAERARDALLALRQRERPRRVLTSPLRRCRETAAPLARALGVEAEVETAVSEIPTPSALSAEERGPWLRAAFEGEWRAIGGDLDYEAWRADVTEALARAASGGEPVAVFSHYVALNAAVSAALDDPRVLAFRPDHCSISVFEVEDGRVRLIEQGREAATGVL